MLDVIEHLFFWLLAAGVAAAFAGWAWHCLQTQPKVEALERERNRLRSDLLNLVKAAEGATPPQEITLGGEISARADILDARVRELERALAEVREANAGHLARVAELERLLEEARGRLVEPVEIETRDNRILALQSDLNAARERLVSLEAAPPPAPLGEPLDQAARWRLRYLEARVRHLEGQAPAPQPLAAALPVPTPAPAEDEVNRLRWQARYYAARVRYLESLPQAAPTPVAAAAPVPAADPDDERKRWRLRYLEARIAYLETRAAPAPAAAPIDTAPLTERIAQLEQETAAIAGLTAERDAASAQRDGLAAELEAARAALPPAEARIAELEARLAAPPPPLPPPVEDPELGRLRWRVRYLDARVAHLEAKLAQAQFPAPAPPPPPPAPAPQPVAAAPPSPPPPPPPPAPVLEAEEAPLVPRGAEVRPMALAAPRGGAPDDLRMIVGVGPRVETTLNSLGIHHFDQIAAWTPANIAWVDQYLRFRGRISRERWVEQAAALARGEEAEGKRLYLEGG